jgi:hypothetical protein
MTEPFQDAPDIEAFSLWDPSRYIQKYGSESFIEYYSLVQSRVESIRQLTDKLAMPYPTLAAINRRFLDQIEAWLKSSRSYVTDPPQSHSTPLCPKCGHSLLRVGLEDHSWDTAFACTGRHCRSFYTDGEL